jgi:hypothetical protein
MTRSKITGRERHIIGSRDKEPDFEGFTPTIFYSSRNTS